MMMTDTHADVWKDWGEWRFWQGCLALLLDFGPGLTTSVAKQPEGADRC
jgi:hypothetical protein